MIKKIVIEKVRDIDLTHVFECGQCFRWVPLEDPEEDGRRYIGAAGDKAAVISLDGDSLIIETTGGDRDFWRDYFDLDTDYSAIKDELVRNEPSIKAATGYGSGIRILNQDLFETIISFIISQNNNIPRIRKNLEALCRSYGSIIEGSEALRPDGEPVYAFPSAASLAAADVGDLAALRLGYRSKYIKKTSERFLEKGCPASREELLQLEGVGPKVANCIMLFGLHDTGAFPVDTWVKHIMNDMYGFEEKDAAGMQAFACGHFGRLAGYAQQYLFYYYRDGGPASQKMLNSSH